MVDWLGRYDFISGVLANSGSSYVGKTSGLVEFYNIGLRRLGVEELVVSRDVFYPVLSQSVTLCTNELGDYQSLFLTHFDGVDFLMIGYYGLDKVIYGGLLTVNGGRDVVVLLDDFNDWLVNQRFFKGNQLSVLEELFDLLTN